MPPSLFLEQHSDGLAFYINGALQFDTADEAIYHAHLVAPAIGLAAVRFPNTPLRVLICGGGDGLAARDALRFEQVAEVVLVDYSPEVIELGLTRFAPYNRNSLGAASGAELGAGRVTVFTQEAFEFVSALPDACFHVVIDDFTYPLTADETQVHSREWFEQLRRILYPAGTLAHNAVSPEQTTAGFWCIYQSILAADLQAKPVQIVIPSFRQHEYGNWGFCLASSEPIARTELDAVQFPSELEVLDDSWQDVFLFASSLADQRHTINIHSLEHPQLLYYLLNPGVLKPSADYTQIDFRDIQEPGTRQLGTGDLLQLDALAKRWLTQLQRPDADSVELLPVQHHYHNPRMVKEWVNHLRASLSELDGRQLITQLLERAQELPPKLAQDLKQLQQKLRSNQPLQISEATGELITILVVTLMVANLTSPDPVFAKGYYGGGGYYNDDGTSGEGAVGWVGLIMMISGGFWLWNINRED